MGHLPLTSHAGGEFVFLRIEKDLPAVAAIPDQDDDPVLEVAQLKQQVIVRGRAQSHHAAVQLFEQGATNSAIRVLASFGDDRYSKALTEDLLQKTKQARIDRIHKLIEALDKRKAEANDRSAAWKEYARPRIVALLDANVAEGVEVDPAIQKLLKVYLTTELGLSGKLQVVEREALAEVLEEMNIGASGLADERASLTIGKLLPASLLIMGDIIPSDDSHRIMLRLIDTETTRILSAFKGVGDADHDLADVCEDLGEKITQVAVRARPLSAHVLSNDGDTLRAGAGSFHGTSLDTKFIIHQRTTPDATKPNDFRDTKVGSAIVVGLGEETCDLKPTFTAVGETPEISSLWVVETQ